MIDLDGIIMEELARGNGNTVIWNEAFGVVVNEWISIHGDADIGYGLSVYQFRYRNLSLIVILTAVPLEMVFKNLSYLMLQVWTDVRLMGKCIVDNFIVTAVAVFLQSLSRIRS